MRQIKFSPTTYDICDCYEIFKNRSWTENGYNHMAIKNDECIYRITGSVLRIYFKGSDVGFSKKDRSDWKSNFNAYPTIDRMHNGFRSSALRFFETIDYCIDYFNINRLEIGGWSRGGALAQVVWEHYRKNFSDIICVASVSPRVFSKSKAEDIKKRDEDQSVILINQKFGKVDNVPFKFNFTKIGREFTLKPKWWYFMPSMFFRWIGIHLDWYDNMQRGRK